MSLAAPSTPNADVTFMERIASVIAGNSPGDATLLNFAKLLLCDVDDAEMQTSAPEELARLAADAFAFFKERPLFEVAIRIVDAGDRNGRHRISVIEIVNDDMPYLLDTLLAELRDAGVSVHLVAHPILNVARDAGGRVVTFGASAQNGVSAGRESFIHLHTSRVDQAEARQALIVRLQTVLRKARAVAFDNAEMMARLNACIAAYESAPPPLPVDAMGEAIHFLKWIAAGNFTLLGARSYDFVAGDGMGELRPIASSGLGLLRDPELTVLRRGGGGVKLTAESREFFLSSSAIVFATANARSTVYRRGHMDSIGVKAYSATGEVTGETRFVGFFSTAAFIGSTRNIPLVRLKVDNVLRRAGHSPESHSGKTLSYVLETFPRGELLQISDAQLLEWTTAISQLTLNPRTRVFVREDEFGRFVSVLVYGLRDRYTSSVREKITAFFAEVYGGTLAYFTPFFPDGPMVRLQIVIWREEGDLPRYPQAHLEKEIENIVRTWRDELSTQLQLYYGDGASPRIAKYLAAFPAGYEDTTRPTRAIEDIQRLEGLTAENPTAIDIFSDADGATNRLRATLYQLDEPIALSRRVPILENLGFKVISERTFELSPMMSGAPRPVFLHDSVIETTSGAAILFKEHENRLEHGFLAIWRGHAANDTFNGLMLNARIDWREAALMRAYGAYLRQTGAPFDLPKQGEILNKHGEIVSDLVEIFHAMFDPARGLSVDDRKIQAAKLAAWVLVKLEDVPSIEEDRVLRHFLNLIRSTLRTNFYQRNDGGGLPETIAFKLRSEKVEGLPSPKPYAEIFVTSPRFEGVHLRGGPIARGGLRWSDRAQDFRTEVLSLAKAQQVKNTVIVPQGAKGGFVPRNLPVARDAMLAEGVACYKSFIATLLSITDNLVDGAIAPPPRVVRHDGDDPYLVVAADKGTATFSDIANGIALEHGFWLGDAFASGGSVGYDHKKMAITARGGWEAVKRHFREMNADIQTTPFRVIGVGDMSGDVFGNGMLLSRAIKLVAAFDHRDIFLDPDPDTETSWEERKRMFDLPRSSWQDYNRALISSGGSVFSRNVKSIDLPLQAQALLGLPSPATPNQIMNAILKMQTDLLWFGGIGTFIRATTETNEQAGDRTNDTIRVTALEVLAKVIGEGANLGLTQKARIEFGLNGGRINTDAIDNSAGVNSSDFEVNIKIGLASAMASGKLTLEDRNVFLASMTDQVADSVLRNNYLQTLAISLGERRGMDDLGFQRRLMQKFEVAGLLDRKLEGLPSDGELAERRMKAQPLTRPELAVLLAYSKIDLKREILASHVPDDPYLSQELSNYFPAAMRERFGEEIAAHRLRREIVATVLTNDIINCGGSTFSVRLADETGHEPETIAYAFAAAMGVFGMASMYNAIDALDGKVDGGRQLALYHTVQDALRQTTAWFLRHGRFELGLTKVIEAYRDGVHRMATTPALNGNGEAAARSEMFAAWGASEALAGKLAKLPDLAKSLEIVLTAQTLGQDEAAVGRAFSETESYFRLDELRARSVALGQGDHFDRLAVNGTLEALAGVQRAIVTNAIRANSGVASFAAWLEANASKVARVRKNISETLDAGELTLAKLTVAASHLRDLG
ncbi:MAG: NAD-glutamate dehydrogenase [Hyphomicrobiales bacterium]|nr:NAD-glutamate dehydrogenase [Hyphomicrobiales bacterium]